MWRRSVGQRISLPAGTTTRPSTKEYIHGFFRRTARSDWHHRGSRRSRAPRDLGWRRPRLDVVALKRVRYRQVQPVPDRGGLDLRVPLLHGPGRAVCIEWLVVPGTPYIEWMVREAAATHSTAASVPRRLRVLGTSGAGKSRLAARVSEVLGVPRLELDAVFWDADWTYRDLDEARSLVRD